MGSGSRGLLLCKSSSSLVFLIPSFTCNNLRFNKTIASSRAHRMATEASSSSSSVTGGDSINPPPSSSVNGAAFSSSSSSAIDFLSLCHRLKVLFILFFCYFFVYFILWFEEHTILRIEYRLRCFISGSWMNSICYFQVLFY